MKRKHILIFLGGIILALLFFLGRTQETLTLPASTQPVKLTVSAAISLKGALQKIDRLYQSKQSNIEITYNFGSSGSLQQQIEQGAPVDIFISAAAQQMNALQAKNLLLERTRQDLLSNQMALITPKNEVVVQKIQDLTNAKIRKIALGEPKSVPAGHYGEEVLKYYHTLDSLKSKIIYGKDVRQVLNYVETGNVNAGLVYITDAKTSQRVRIAAIAPASAHSPIVYPIAVLKDSKSSNAAQAFIQFLASPPAKAIFKQYGFQA